MRGVRDGVVDVAGQLLGEGVDLRPEREHQDVAADGGRHAGG